MLVIARPRGLVVGDLCWSVPAAGVNDVRRVQCRDRDGANIDAVDDDDASGLTDWMALMAG
jgi:hypothetical protein